MGGYYERADNGDNTYSQLVKQTGSNAKTVQTHNGVSVATSGASGSGWIDCNGYKDINLTMMQDAATTGGAYMHWSNDGTTVHGYDANSIASSALQYKAGTVKIKARYAKLTLTNADTAAHTMSAWMYLTI